jgi:BirA family biotin operon repressor/biotin-[acetyl-CoA-carboxylase] ligase
VGYGRETGADEQRQRYVLMRLCYFKKIESTNEKAKELAKKGISDIVVVADRQTRGKGRFNRKWFSFSGGIYLSILLKERNFDKMKYLTFIAAIGVVKAIEKISGIKAMIKWPNDVHINKKKVCGILTESVLGRENYAVIGVGINANQQRFPKELKGSATSLRVLLGKETSKEKIIMQFLKEFHALHKLYKNKEYGRILEMWKYYCDTIGKNIKVVTLKETFCGKAIGVDNDCNLVVKLKNRRLKRVVEGDIFVLD